MGQGLHWQDAHAEEAWERQGELLTSDPLSEYVKREMRELGVNSEPETMHLHPLGFCLQPWVLYVRSSGVLMFAFPQRFVEWRPQFPWRERVRDDSGQNYTPMNQQDPPCRADSEMLAALKDQRDSSDPKLFVQWGNQKLWDHGACSRWHNWSKEGPFRKQWRQKYQNGTVSPCLAHSHIADPCSAAPFKPSTLLLTRKARGTKDCVFWSQ